MSLQMLGLPAEVCSPGRSGAEGRVGLDRQTQRSALGGLTLSESGKSRGWNPACDQGPWLHLWCLPISTSRTQENFFHDKFKEQTAELGEESGTLAHVLLRASPGTCAVLGPTPGLLCQRLGLRPGQLGSHKPCFDAGSQRWRSTG